MFGKRKVTVDQSNSDIGIGHVEYLNVQQISGNRNSNGNGNGQSKQPTPPPAHTASYGIGVQLNSEERDD